MIKVLPRNIARFIFLILIQVFIFNNIQFSGYINPYIYILFILLLPFETPKWMLLVTAAFLGLTIDIFSDTLGMHTIATLFLAFLRPFVLNLISPRDGYESGTFPRVAYYGINWFTKYASILIVAHHFVLFYIEIFRFGNFFSTFFRVILSTIFSLTFIVLSQFFVYRR
ncbi:MAG: rod shape-determining protein MreD [Bacteroidales bacterium]|nr:MAG: rod shape-determining protein MreD [Bacteroidales bacterium]